MSHFLMLKVFPILYCFDTNKLEINNKSLCDAFDNVHKVQFPVYKHCSFRSCRYSRNCYRWIEYTF